MSVASFRTLEEDNYVYEPSSPTCSERSSLVSMNTRRRKRRKANRERMVKLVKRIAGYSASAFLSIALTFSISIIPLSRVGAVLGTDTLSNASVALFTLYIFAQYPLMGFGLALDTLCSQEFGRNHNSRVMGLILRRGVLMGTVAVIPMALLFYVFMPIGLGYFYTPDVIIDSKRFLLPAPLYLVLFNFYMCLGKFCFNQLHPVIPVISVAVGALVVTPIVSYFTVPYGLTATMLGMCLAWGVQSVVLVVLVLRVPSLRYTLWLNCPWTRQEASGFPVGAVDVFLDDDEDDADNNLNIITGPDMDAFSDVGEGVRRLAVGEEHEQSDEGRRPPPRLPPATSYNSICNSEGQFSHYSAYSVAAAPIVVVDEDDDEEDDRSMGLYVLNPVGIKEYMALAVPSVVLVVGEGSAFDLTVLMAAALGSSAGASWSALLSFTLWFVAVAGGISGAANALVGGALGRGDAKLASTYARLVVIISLTMSILNSCVIILCFDSMLVAFGLASPDSASNPEHIPTLTEQICGLVKWMLPIYHIGESVQYALQGVFSGLGRSDMAARLLMGTLWIIGVPLSLGLGFYGVPRLAQHYKHSSLCLHDPDQPLTGCSVEVGVVGIVLGLIIAMSAELPALLYALYFINWKGAAKMASVENPK